MLKHCYYSHKTTKLGKGEASRQIFLKLVLELPPATPAAKNQVKKKEGWRRKILRILGGFYDNPGNKNFIYEVIKMKSTLFVPSKLTFSDEC